MTTDTKVTPSKPTPGPWAHDEESDCFICVFTAYSDDPIAHVRCFDGSDAGESGNANARLIAAAPELLEACQELLEICRWKCSPSDEVVLSNGKSNHQAMIDADNILSAAGVQS